MSTEIGYVESTVTVNTPISVNTFYGGGLRGQCIQLNQRPFGHGINMTRAQVEVMVEVLQAHLRNSE